MAFAAIVVAFFLPFVTASCDGERAEATGIQLVTETVPGADESDSVADWVEDDAVIARVAFLSAIVGFGLSLLRRERRWLLILVTLLGALAFAYGGLDASSWNGEEGEQIEVQLKSGFWIAFMLFVALFVSYVSAAIASRRSRGGDEGRFKLPPGAVPL